MSQYISVLDLTLRSAAALMQKRFVGYDGNYATAATAAMGVTKFDADAAGEDVTVTVSGTAIITAGGAIAKGASIEVGTTGKAVTLAAGVKVGRALEAAAADGDQIEVLLITA